MPFSELFSFFPLRRWPYLPAAMTAVLGLVLTVLAVRLVGEDESGRVLFELQRRVENHARAIEHGIAEKIGLIDETRGLFAALTEGSDGPEALLGRIDLKRADLAALAWLSNPESAHPAHEFHCRPRPDCAGLRDHDPTARGPLRDLLRRARMTGGLVAGTLFDPPTGGPAGLIVVAPVFGEQAVASWPSGYLIGLFDIALLVDGILGSTTVPSGLDAYILQDEGAPPGRLLHFHPSRSGEANRTPLAGPELEGRDIFHQTITVADRQWLAAFQPLPETVRALRSNETTVVTVFGFLLTGLLVYLLILGGRRARRIESLVLARTLALHDANRALEEKAAIVHFLRGVAVCANEAAGIRQALETGIEEVCRFTGWPIGHAYVPTPGRDEGFRPAGLWRIGLESDISEFRSATDRLRRPAETGLPGAIAVSGRPQWGAVADFEAGAPRGIAAARSGIRTMIGLPVTVGSDVVTVLEFFSLEPLPPDPTLIEALAFAGTQFGRVVERKVAEERLRATKDQAEQANVAKSRFLAAASHDLRQPLQALNLFVNVLATRNADDAAAPVIGHIKESLSTLDGLLNALLNISKLEAGLIVPEVVSFPLGDLLRRLETEFRPQAEEAGFRFKVVETRARVFSDPGLVERILRNFLANALRYTERGGLLLGCRRRGNALLVGVWDTGIGIPEDQRQEIFEEFHQLQASPNGHNEGLGLGLAIVERLARLLSHPVGLASRVGKGSAFTIRVPLAARGGGAAPAAEAPLPRGRKPGGTVLVIDDEETVRAAMSLQLEAWNFKVVLAGSVAEAVRRAGEARPDLILADYRLRQGETGDKAIAAVRRAVGRQVPGLLLTGDTAPKRLTKAKKSGFRLLHKPVPADILHRAMVDSLEP